jgi:hypothetical protein
MSEEIESIRAYANSSSYRDSEANRDIRCLFNELDRVTARCAEMARELSELRLQCDALGDAEFSV